MQNDRIDLYAVLGLTPHATQTEIGRAYRALVRTHHPDTRAPQSQNTTSDARLQHVLAAYTVLGDPARRTEYDQRPTRDRLQALRQAPPPRPAANPGQGPPIQAGPVHWHRRY